MHNHPDIETLANYTAGLLNEGDADITSSHLETCRTCRLEVKRMERFERIDSDTDLQEEANWLSARVKLERAFADNVLPEVAQHEAREARLKDAERKIIDTRPFWTRWQLRFLVPVAAAVAVALVAIRIAERIGPADDIGPMRGPTTESFDIAIEQPSGKIAEPPALFSWKSRR
jgi:anti-sigma factor RsiW